MDFRCFQEQNAFVLMNLFVDEEAILSNMFYKDWTDEQGKTNINNLAKTFGHSTEPLAQVVQAWQLGFIGGVQFSGTQC